MPLGKIVVKRCDFVTNDRFLKRRLTKCETYLPSSPELPSWSSIGRFSVLLGLPSGIMYLGRLIPSWLNHTHNFLKVTNELTKISYGYII